MSKNDRIRARIIEMNANARLLARATTVGVRGWFVRSWWRSHICCRWHFAATVAYRASSSLLLLVFSLSLSLLVVVVVSGFRNNGNAIKLHNQKESNNNKSKEVKSFIFVVVVRSFVFVFVFSSFVVSSVRHGLWPKRDDWFVNVKKIFIRNMHRTVYASWCGFIRIQNGIATHTHTRSLDSILSLQWISWQNSCVILKAFHAISFAQADMYDYGRLPLQRTHLSTSSLIFLFYFYSRNWWFVNAFVCKMHQRQWVSFVFLSARLEAFAIQNSSNTRHYFDWNKEPTLTNGDGNCFEVAKLCCSSAIHFETRDRVEAKYQNLSWH